MRIDAINQVSQIYQTSKPKKVAKANEESKSDQYQISRSGKDYQIAKNALSETADIREDKVAELKEAISSGTYNVSAQSVAESIVSKYFESIG